MKAWLRIPLFSLSALLTALFISWYLLASLNFGYSALYEWMNIDEHISHYGPQNRYRSSFETTTKNEHVRLFEQITIAIHNKGTGLAEIQYLNEQNQPIDTLLREPEVIHLQDVANLIEVVDALGLLAVAILLTISSYMLLSKQTLPNIKQQTIAVVSVSLLLALVVVIIGPVTVFYELHEWVFPENHQWFFYYQESLMTILMKAPDLFGYIAVLIVLLGLVIFTLINLLLSWAQTQLNKHKFNLG